MASPMIVDDHIF